MVPIRHPRLLRPRALALGLSLLLATSLLPLRAQETPPAETAQATATEADLKGQLAAYENGDHSPGLIAALLPQLADPARRNAVRGRLQDPLPVPELVALLKHPSLAVRLGSLELLEEKAGGDFSFNPWNTPGAPDNEGPLARWDQWRAKDTGKPGQSSVKSLLGDDQRRGYLRDLLGQDDDKASRARHMLESDGLGSVAFLEDFIASAPALPAGSRAKVRQAQYQIVLASPLGPGAAETARNLAFGSRDQLLSALATTKAAGPLSLPILRDFIDNADPLVRETAIDSILASGGADAVPLVAPVLEKEPDVNVIHGALRRLKDVPGAASAKLAASFLSHSDEDLLVSAIQTCLKLAGGDETASRFSRSTGPTADDGEGAIIAALSDQRWRVRVAALEYVAGRKVSKASDAVLKALDDPDDFVRFAAIKTASALGMKSALPKLKAALLADESMTGPVLEGYAAMKASPDAEMLAHLAKATPEARIAAIRAAATDKSLSSIVTGFAADVDLDVACAALRFLSSDDDLVAENDIASVLVQALRSGTPEKRAAVLDRLTLPEIKSVDPATMQLLGAALERPEKTALDPLYEGFLKPLGVAGGEGTPSAPLIKIPAVQAALVKELVALSKDDKSPDLAFSAALSLARAGQPDGYTALTRMLPGLSTARKAAIGEDLRSPSHRDALPLLQGLLQDQIEEIRAAAASCALSNDKAPAFTRLVFEELIRPDAALQPHEVYSYHLESIIRSQSCGTTLRAWSVKVLQDEKSTGPLKVLACISLRNQTPSTLLPVVTALAKSSPNQWVRRAAAQVIGWSKSPDWKTLVESLSNDPSPYVRETVPAVANRQYASWSHHFDDVHVQHDNYYNYSSSTQPVSRDPVLLAALEKLAAPTEVSPIVRFNALFALMAAGKPVEVDAMVQLLRQQPEEASAPNQLADWFEKSASQVGPGLRPLFAVVNIGRIDADKLQILKKRLNPGGTGQKAPVSFASLASQAAAPAAAQQIATPTTGTVETIERHSLPVVFFYKPGCHECAKTRDLLDTLKRDHPTLAVEEHNILEADSVVLNQALCGHFQVPSQKHSVAPSLFTQGGFLITEDITPPALAALLGKTAAISQDDAWKSIDQPQLEEAKEQVTQRYQALTLPVVIGAGLLDGVNPCAFATIIFFLSYLQIARRTRREMLMTGAAFILGVFLAYLAAGLVLYQVLATLHQRFSGIQNWLNPIFAGLALLAAVLSFRDAARAKAGRMDDMTLQLPGFLKTRIRGVIRTGARARRFVIAAFLAGIVISFLELACTGQVYAPIVYQIQQGKLDAVAMLVLYNLAFILPLIVIFLLAYGGLRSEALLALQKRHAFMVKIALGVLFLLLAAFILLGERLISH